METFLASLALAAITALAYLAYKHPHAYRKIVFPLLGILVVVLLCITCWELSAIKTRIALSPFIDIQRLDEARRAVEAIKPPFITTVLVFGCASFYLILLSMLPYVLEEEEDDKPKEPQPEKDEKEP